MKLNQFYDKGVMPIHIGGSILCAAILLASWFLGLEPMMTGTQQTSSVTDQAEQAEVEAKRVKGKLDRVVQQLDEVQGQLDQRPLTLQPASQINPLLADLAGWSELDHLSVTRTSAGRPEALAYYDYVPIELAGEGGYTDLLSFFNRLYGERGDLGVISFDIKRKASGTGLTFEIQLAWYVLSDDMEEGEAADPRPTASVPTR
ncbi:MAG: type 4a pilus biogenesis protein PilO [Planctomycetota bacterium]